MHDHCPHCGAPPDSALRDFFRAELKQQLQQLRTDMTKLSDALTQLSTTDQALVAEIGDVLTDIDALQASNGAAITAALAQAGVADDAAADIVNTVNTDLAAQIDAIKAKLAPTPAPDAPAPVEPAAPDAPAA